LETAGIAAEVALWAEATLEDDFVPVYLGKSTFVETAGEKGLYSWGLGASHSVVGVAAEEALQVPVTEKRYARHKTSITVQSHCKQI
jgi:hypothetical protein